MQLAAALDEALDLHRQGKLREAYARYATILAEHPGNPSALHYSGVVLHQSGDHAGAVDLIRQSIQADAAPAEPWANLAQALVAVGRPEAAINALKEAARRAPSQPEIWSNLASAELTLGRYTDAEASARRAIAIDARYATGWYNLALVLEPQGRVLEALDAASRAAVLVPDAMAHAGLKAQLQADLGQLVAARKTLEAAIARAPTAAPLHSQFAGVAEELEDFAGATQALEHVIRLDPQNGAALSQLLFLRKRLCDWHDLPARRALFQAGVAAGRSWLTPFSLLSDPSTRALQHACSKAWSGQFVASPAAVRPRLALSAGRMRIGYLSADFFDHPTAVLTAGLFEQHDRARFNIIGYSTGPDDGSAMRNRVAAAFDRFVEARNWPPERLAAQIRADRIDILVDLKGHTAGAPTATLALRPAPIQVHYLGYPGTMGAAYVDYLIGDRVVTPLEHAADYTETLVHLPGSYQVNDRRRLPSPPPPREALGLPADALVFCCFNNTFKLNPEVVDAWARILLAQPDSVLWLLARGEQDPAIGNLRREFAGRGVESSRLVFALHRAHDDYLALYHHADLFLDTWPYNAHTTASDALWCGCPIVTWRGEAFAGRVAASLLTAVGLPELIASNVDDYVARAIELATDRGKLAHYRTYLIGAGRESALFDVVKTAQALETAYLRMAAQFRSGARSPIVIGADES